MPEARHPFFEKWLRLIAVVPAFGLATSCAPPQNGVPLHTFMNSLQEEVGKADPLVRLSITQISEGEGDKIIKGEQDRQCSRDPILVFFHGDLGFTLKTTVTEQTGISATKTLVPHPALIPTANIQVTGSNEHDLQYNATPVSLGDLPNYVFQGDVEVVKTLSTMKGSESTVRAYLNEAWGLRKKLLHVTTGLMNDWKRPNKCSES